MKKTTNKSSNKTAKVVSPVVVAEQTAETVVDVAMVDDTAIPFTAMDTTTQTVEIETPDNHIDVDPYQLELDNYREALTLLPTAKHSREADKLRNSFIELLGLPKAVNANGYKQGDIQNDQMLSDVIMTRDKFEILCTVTGKYFPILEKMNRNLRNSDRASKFAALERANAKKKTNAQ